jgi:hypothetical protein
LQGFKVHKTSVRLVIGNPLVMKEMAKHVPDAGSYAPVTVLVDEREDGMHLSYDTGTQISVAGFNLPAHRHTRMKRPT